METWAHLHVVVTQAANLLWRLMLTRLLSGELIRSRWTAVILTHQTFQQVRRISFSFFFNLLIIKRIDVYQLKDKKGVLFGIMY